MNKNVKRIVFYVLMTACVCSLMVYNDPIYWKTEVVKAVVFILSITGIYFTMKGCSYEEAMDITGLTWLSKKFEYIFDDDDE